MAPEPCDRIPKIQHALKATRTPYARARAEAIDLFRRLSRERCLPLGEHREAPEEGPYDIRLELWAVEGEGVVVAVYHGGIPAERYHEEGIALADRTRAVVTPTRVMRDRTTVQNPESVLAPELERVLTRLVRELERRGAFHAGA